MRKETERSLPPEPLEIKERVKVTGNAVVNDSAFWEEYRPIPLSGEETLSFSEKDSIIEKMNSPEYKDSIRSAQRKFKFKYLLLGKTFVYKDDSTKYTNRFSMPGLVQLSSFSYNTVDGFRYEMDFSYSLTDTSGHVLRAATDVAYAFHRKNFDADLSISYLINPFNMSRITINGGHVTMDYGSGMSVLLNTVYTLFAEENYKKYYQKDYIQFRYSREIINGMTFDGDVEYSYRQPLQNHASFRIVNWKDKEFTDNIPSHPDMDSTLIEAHRAMFFTFNFDYTPRQRYYLRKTGKYPAESKYPTFFLTYRKAVEGHISWSTDRLLFKRLPLINNTLIEENLFFNYLTTPDHLNYIEIGYGLSNIFLMFNIEGMIAFENWNYKMVGLRISTNIF